jgi:hypothetical protein
MGAGIICICNDCVYVMLHILLTKLYKPFPRIIYLCGITILFSLFSSFFLPKEATLNPSISREDVIIFPIL